jgi:hypothetical protein
MPAQRSTSTLHVGRLAGEPLALDPVNVWTATLILALGLDVNRSALGKPGS